MKQFLITFIVFVVSTFAFDASAQRPPCGDKDAAPREEMTKKQAEYIANEMQLEGETRDRFIATFCDCQTEIWELGPPHDRGKDKPRTDEEAVKNAENRFARSRQILEIREKYHELYGRFLSPLQIEEVYRLEKQTLDRMFQHHHDPNGGPGDRKKPRGCRPSDDPCR